MALGASETSQVGYGVENKPGQQHDEALLWYGSPESFVKLHPPGYTATIAGGVSGTSQVGWGLRPGEANALLWSGSVESVVNLNPLGFDESQAFGVSSAGQAGLGWSDGALHALAWKGSAASAVDLHQFLTGFEVEFTSSVARGIADNGAIIGRATDRDGRTHPVLWIPVPEPSSLVLAALGVPADDRPSLPGPRRPPGEQLVDLLADFFVALLLSSTESQLWSLQPPVPQPPDPSSVFPRQSGPFTLVVTASDSPSGGGAIRGFTLGYDVTYDISSVGATEDADFDGDGDVDGTDFLTWQPGLGIGTDRSAGDPTTTRTLKAILRHAGWPF